MSIPELSLNDGTTIPQLGFGVFKVEPEQTAEVVSQAIEAGYRHFDTAQMYGNEKGVGEAIAASSIPREDFYITTKLNNNAHRPDDARRAIAQSVEDLGGAPDLFLIHWPVPTQYDGDYPATWQVLVDAREAGQTRSVGVSNFQPDHLDRIVSETGVVPTVNQIEVHPYFCNEQAREADRRHGVITEAWSPIAHGAIVEDEALAPIADRLGRTISQVVLRWHLQRGDIIIPKTVNPDRMRENIGLFDFELTAEDMAAVSALDRGTEGRRGPNPDTFDWIG